jgi:hypothetical protein
MHPGILKTKSRFVNDFWAPQDPGREIWLDDCIYLLYSHLYTMYTHFSMKLSNVKFFFRIVQNSTIQKFCTIRPF